MKVSLRTLTQIIHSFSVSTGVPAFVIDGAGTFHSASSGFSPQDYEFADTGQLRELVVEGLHRGKLTPNLHHTLCTDHQFIYNLVCIDLEEEVGSESYSGRQQVLATGPMRLKPSATQNPHMITPHKGSDPTPEDTIAERISRLPVVPMSRVHHLGRVQASLCRSYGNEGGPIPVPSTDTPDMLPVSFTLVDEASHVSQELLLRIKEMVLSGNLKDAQDVWEPMATAPLDRLIEADPVKSARYNLIATCGTIVGMMFDEGLPYEQLMMTADRYIRKADGVGELSTLIQLIRRSVEDFARLAQQYSARNYSRPVRQVLQFVQSNLRRKISLQDVADRAGLSPSYLSRLIKRETGMSLSQLVTSYRVNESKFLLLRTDHPILDIAQMVGYTYQNHFTERFKQHTGTTPSQYRRAGRDNG